MVYDDLARKIMGEESDEFLPHPEKKAVLKNRCEFPTKNETFEENFAKAFAGEPTNSSKWRRKHSPADNQDLLGNYLHRIYNQ
jgi:hypothetical protein